MNAAKWALTIVIAGSASPREVTYRRVFGPNYVETRRRP